MGDPQVEAVAVAGIVLPLWAVVNVTRVSSGRRGRRRNPSSWIPHFHLPGGESFALIPVPFAGAACHGHG